jgi:predicted Zn-dependent protease
MPAFFERLQLANRYTDTLKLPEFLRTHPVTVSRIADSRSRADQYPRVPYKNSLNFHLVRAKLRLATSSTAHEALNYFEQLRKNGSIDEQMAARYGQALAQTSLGQYDKARGELEYLQKMDGDELAYRLALARLEMAMGHTEQGLQIYAATLKLYPNYRPVVLGYAEALLKADQPKQAQKLLRDYSRHHPPDVNYYSLLADAEGKGGDQVEALIALAERHYLAGDTRLAREHLKFAHRDHGIDHFQRQRIEARLKVIEDELETERKKGFSW